MARPGAAVALTLAALLPPAIAQAGDDAPPPRPLACANPADPRGRDPDCHGLPIDFSLETLSGDWAGLRRAWQRAGVTLTASYAGGYFGAASGPSTAPTYAGQATGAIDVDLARALGAWHGFAFHVSGIWASQTQPESWLNTNLFPVNSLAAGSTAWLAEAYFTQTMLDGQLSAAAGWLGAGNSFGSLPVLGNYISGAFAGNPQAMEANDPAFAAPPPNAQWGVQARYRLAPDWRIGAGVYNNNPNAAAGAKHGTNFRFRQGNRGVLTVAQLDYLPNQAANATGLPGQYSLGGFYDGNDFANLITGAPERGNWNLWALAQQMVLPLGGAASGRGLTVWGGAVYGGQRSINPLPVQAGVGASLKGPWASRANDVASIGLFYGAVGDNGSGATAQSVLEANYQWAIGSAVTLTADFQYFWRLNGLASPGAAVFGLQLAVTL